MMDQIVIPVVVGLVVAWIWENRYQLISRIKNAIREVPRLYMFVARRFLQKKKKSLLLSRLASNQCMFYPFTPRLMRPIHHDQ